MPSLNWIGKDKVINHHNEVPYRVLNKKYTYGDDDAGNMVIHGDNLEALKSLLPKYEGKIRCIYIDPPYNTGNEGWIYNDNVNDPKIESEEELDYSIIGSFAPPEASGKCVYCNHCEPCPAGIDIGAVNKFYDLARIGDDMAREHYRALEKNASDCINCGHCNSRCPFSVDQMSRMQEIRSFF